MRSFFVLLTLVQSSLAIIAPNVSLATVPTAYFGGNYKRRGDENIAMLAKMRLVRGVWVLEYLDY